MLKDMKGLFLAVAIAVAMGALGGCASSNQDQTERGSSSTATQEAPASHDETANSQAQPNEGATMQEPIQGTQAQVTLNGKSFTIDLADNETARAFAGLLPMEAQMSELNGNEKYIRLDSTLPSAATSFATIEAGDVMLYQDDYIVVFYKTHPTSYTYTRIGKIADITGLASAVGNASVDANFELL